MGSGGTKEEEEPSMGSMSSMASKPKPGKSGLVEQAKVPEPEPLVPPLFDFEDEGSRAEALAYLHANGYVVYRDVLDAQEVQEALGLIWDHLEGLGTGIRRDDPETWDTQRWPPNTNTTGVLFKDAIGQSEFLWFLRGRPRVARIFADIWKVPVEDLLTSFDGANVMRPSRYNPKWRTMGGWYHVDQNGLKKPGDRCFQGLVNLLDATAKTSPGLVVVPGSHLLFDDFFVKYPFTGKTPDGSFRRDFIIIHDSQMIEHFSAQPKKLCVPAGALVIWNSRTVHCNAPADELPAWTDPEERKRARLDRVVGYVCMSPRPKDPEVLEALLKKRQRAVQIGETTTHWPDEYIPSSPGPGAGDPPYKEPKLNPHQRRLAGFED